MMEIRKQPKRILVCEDCRVIGTLVSSLTSNPDNQLATIVLVTSVGVLTEILKTSHFDIIYLDGTLDDRQSTIPVANKLSGYEPLAVNFDARSSSACSGSLTYSWDFGDGATATGAQVSHTYRQGTWNVLLTVTNSANVSAIKQKQVTVLPSVEPNLDLYLGFNNNITDLSGRGHVGAWQGVPSYTGGIIQQAGVAAALKEL
jgi:PKD repeat protein